MSFTRQSNAPGVLCAGSIVLDTIVSPVADLRWGTTTFVDTIGSHLGGNGANTARALSILGNRVRLLGTVGNDESATFCIETLLRSGVHVEWIEKTAAPNAASVVLVRPGGDRQFLHRLGSSQDAFQTLPDFTGPVASEMRHFHLASLFVLPHVRRHAPQLLQQAHAAGLTTSLDTNWDARGEWLQVLQPCLPHVDILFLNEDESQMLTGTSDPGKAASFLQDRGASLVVQKLSGAGCSLHQAGSDHSPLHCAPFRVNAIDTTGAGDCFAAGFLSAWLRGGSLAEAGLLANAAGARSVSALGAVTALPMREELHAWMREHNRENS